MYKSFLLRLWRDTPTTAPWRMMLECITPTQERRYFADLDSLVAYLLAELAEVGQPSMANDQEGVPECYDDPRS